MERKQSTISQNARLYMIGAIVVAILMVPFIAMQFTDEVNWGLLDFVLMGVLLSGTGLAIEFVIRKVRKTSYRIMLAVAILLILFLIWAELAVGIFGTPFAGS